MSPSLTSAVLLGEYLNSVWFNSKTVVFWGTMYLEKMLKGIIKWLTISFPLCFGDHLFPSLKQRWITNYLFRLIIKKLKCQPKKGIMHYSWIYLIFSLLLSHCGDPVIQPNYLFPVLLLQYKNALSLHLMEQKGILHAGKRVSGKQKLPICSILVWKKSPSS